MTLTAIQFPEYWYRTAACETNNPYLIRLCINGAAFGKPVAYPIGCITIGFSFPLQCQSGDQVADNSAHPPASGQGRKLPVLFIHDAAIDDFIATLLLVAMPNVDLSFSNRNGFYDYVAPQLARSA